MDGGAFAIPVENTFGFPPQGMLAFLDSRGQANEIVSYTRIGGEGFEMPRGAGPGEGDATERGLFRGRFGTAPVAHEPGTLVYELRFRYWDRAVEGADDPNLAYYQFPIEVGEAWFRSLTWSAKLLQPHLRLRVLARVPDREPDLDRAAAAPQGARWRSGSMVLRWVATAVQQAERGFRRVKGFRNLPALARALRRAPAPLARVG